MRESVPAAILTQVCEDGRRRRSVHKDLQLRSKTIRITIRIAAWTLLILILIVILIVFLLLLLLVLLLFLLPSVSIPPLLFERRHPQENAMLAAAGRRVGHFALGAHAFHVEIVRHDPAARL